MSVNEIREVKQQIANLEGKLAELAGEGLLIVVGDERRHDTPDGGALLTLDFAGRAPAEVYWYSTSESAQAALAIEGRKWGTVPYDPWRFYSEREGVHGSVTRLAWVERQEVVLPPSLATVHATAEAVKGLVSVAKAVSAAEVALIEAGQPLSGEPASVAAQMQRATLAMRVAMTELHRHANSVAGGQVEVGHLATAKEIVAKVLTT
jgi:hypothetical protein